MSLAPLQTNALEIALNDIEKTVHAKNHYVLGTVDPYFVINLNSENFDDSYSLNIELTINALQPESEAPSAQLFWSDSSAAFSQDKSVRFPITYGKASYSIPLDTFSSTPKIMRLDFEGCLCEVNMAPVLAKNKAGQNNQLIPASIEALRSLKYGRIVPIPQWVGVELKPIGQGAFTSTGWDPRIVNNVDLNMPMNKVSGVYFDIDFNFTDAVQKFELFWKLQGLNWNALRSAHFALDGEAAIQARKKIFIPFEPINTERSLKHLRLDFQACESCTFTLNEARIIGSTELEQYQKFTPKRLYFSHTERPPKGYIREQFTIKFLHDSKFILFLAFLFLAVFTLAIYQYRRV